MNITPCSKSDFDQIVTELPEFWGHNLLRALHHPMFLNEFGDCAHVIRDGAKVVAYLFGFVTHPAPVGYIHLVAVRRTHRHLGLARRLYDHFTALALARGCRQLRAITGADNTGSIRFHRSLGFERRVSPMPTGCRSRATTRARASTASFCASRSSRRRGGP